MKLRHQALSAVSATALLLAAGVALIGFSDTSRAAPIDPAVQSALANAVSNPSGAMQALINQMNSEVPGSGAQFAAAFQDTDTNDVASALASLSAGNSALQDTITSALSTLSGDPQLASVTTANGGTVNGSSIVSTISTSEINFAANTPQNPNNGNSDTNNNQNNSNQSVQNNLQDINPTAGPNNNFNTTFNTSTINSPFTRGNPNQNSGLSQSNSSSSSSTSSNTTNTGTTNSGQPNSRS